LRVIPFEALLQVSSNLRASKTNSGPKNDPPIPIATTFLSFLPVNPANYPERTDWEKVEMLFKTWWTSETTLTPSTTRDYSAGFLRATWSTERPSVLLILSPANIALIFWLSWHSFATSMSKSLPFWSSFVWV
jgi:hypothetical protein